MYTTSGFLSDNSVLPSPSYISMGYAYYNTPIFDEAANAYFDRAYNGKPIYQASNVDIQALRADISGFLDRARAYEPVQKASIAISSVQSWLMVSVLGFLFYKSVIKKDK